MKLKSLKLIGYRNYDNLNLDFNDCINIFIGNNAQGKTNILESVCYASMGSSFRTNVDNELIMWDKTGGSISLKFERMGVENKIELIFERGKRRQIIHNGNKIKMKDLIGIFNVVLFSPDDLSLIKGAPSERRRFLDMEISQASPSYYNDLVKYNRILQQRNSLLKNIRENRSKKSMLDMWDSQLVEHGVRIIKKRIETIKKINMLANIMQRRISTNEENLSLSYAIKGFDEPVDKIEENLNLWYNESLHALTDEDIYRGATSVGPHRDDFYIYVNGIDLKSFGSQGQQRTGVLSMKLSELEFIRSEKGEYPVLLLDDVMSELDVGRRQQLLNFIENEKIQTIITATDRAYFPDYYTGIFYSVDNGKVDVVCRK
ncbi:MAG: DNA replication/repair protein RecF [Anaerovibrio sp.]|uniref:DNA replication/repair protein RecF n=1 Tax=Anaerovibrio sp. TaxID=1872532 RepID=UPI0025CEE8B9|nr:DNA replication/repair protein RecF [Anaerovibrio sp.]MCR5176071.1 DNA replication/repair protein RecF [Anaerovibrio sp.]